MTQSFGKVQTCDCSLVSWSIILKTSRHYMFSFSSSDTHNSTSLQVLFCLPWENHGIKANKDEAFYSSKINFQRKTVIHSKKCCYSQRYILVTLLTIVLDATFKTTENLTFPYAWWCEREPSVAATELDLVLLAPAPGSNLDNRAPNPIFVDFGADSVERSSSSASS